MILQRLVDYYDRLAAASEDPIPPIGFSRERISFELVIDRGSMKGTLNDLRSSSQPSPKKKAVIESRWMTVPYRGDRSSNIKANFLWDNSGYVFGRSSKGGSEQKKRNDFIKLHRQLLAITPDPDLETVLAFLDLWEPANYDSFQLASDALDQNIVFRIAGQPSFLHESLSLKNTWQNFFLNDIERTTGVDLVDGSNSEIAVTHFLVGGVSGAQPTGASLCSFNDTAYTSYGLRSSLNAPVSISNVFKYTTAMKEQLSYRRRKVVLGDSTTIFWADQPTMLEDMPEIIFGDLPAPRPEAPPEDHERIRQVRLFLTQIRDGHAYSEVNTNESAVGFYVLGLAAPALSRISVRFWVQSTVGEMQNRLAQHLRDTELSGSRPDDPPMVIRRIVQATGRAEFTAGSFKGYDDKAVPDLLAGALARAVFQGTPYPPMLLGQVLNRIRADGHISHVRVATIKACLIRNSRIGPNPMEVPVALDTNRTEPAYVTGRLFALLEKIQSDSLGGDLNSTIKDRYFSAASATPASVFPRLTRMCQHHLEKLPSTREEAISKRTRTRATYDSLLNDVFTKVGEFQSHFNPQEQGIFTVAYFQQNQSFYTKATEKEGTIE